ncbi:hypothetical protein EJ06DRAFT_465476, partial [Trichodelitschia bisporula]
IAVKALYRALLTQCESVPLREEQRDALRNIVRNRFKANIHLVSPRLLRLSLHAGYTALDRLDASVAGHFPSTMYITRLLGKTPRQLTAPPEPKVREKKLYPDSVLPPPEYKFFNRFPRPTVEGIRRVPRMISANQVPFIRWKKPQPRNVSRIIRWEIDNRRKETDRRHNLHDYYISITEHEDKWDSILEREFRIKNSREERAWCSVPQQQLREVNLASAHKAAEMEERVKKYQAVVDAEAALAEKERNERKQAARKRR